MLNMNKNVTRGMLRKNISPIKDSEFQATYSVQYQLDVIRKAILNQPGAKVELQVMEEARYGNT